MNVLHFNGSWTVQVVFLLKYLARRFLHGQSKHKDMNVTRNIGTSPQFWFGPAHLKTRKTQEQLSEIPVAVRKNLQCNSLWGNLVFCVKTFCLYGSRTNFDALSWLCTHIINSWPKRQVEIKRENNLSTRWNHHIQIQVATKKTFSPSLFHSKDIMTPFLRS